MDCKDGVCVYAEQRVVCSKCGRKVYESTVTWIGKRPFCIACLF